MSDMGPLIPATPGNLDLGHLERTLGVYFVGYVLMAILYGFVFFQTYIYFSRYNNDSWGLKLAVAILVSSDTVVTVLLSQALYYYFVTLFPYTLGLDYATREFIAALGLSTVTVYASQMLYVCRLWSASKNVIVTGITAMLSTVAFALGLAMTVELSNHRAFVHLAVNPGKALAATSQASGAVASLCTLVALSYYLTPSRVPAMKPLSTWYDHFVINVITRGGCATVVQFGYFISFIIAPSHQYWMPFQFVATKLFVCCIFTMLNSRFVHKGQGINEENSASRSNPTGTTASTRGRMSTGDLQFKTSDTKPVVDVRVPTATTTSSDHGKAGASSGSGYESSVIDAMNDTRDKTTYGL